MILVAGGNSIPVARDLAKKHKQINLIEEKVKQGKPAAVDLIIRKAKGEYLFFIDGDVKPITGFFKPMLTAFQDNKIGVVSTRTVPKNSRDTMCGFWAHFLSQKAHEERLAKEFFPSGNLYAVRTGIVRSVPHDVVSDELYIASEIKKAGYKGKYVPEATVEVLFAQTISDYIKQRRRTFLGFQQLKERYNFEVRGFSYEAKKGFFYGFRFAKNQKEVFWFLVLAFVRGWSWLLSYYDYRIRKKGVKEIWSPVTSTK